MTLETFAYFILGVGTGAVLMTISVVIIVLMDRDNKEVKK